MGTEKLQIIERMPEEQLPNEGVISVGQPEVKSPNVLTQEEKPNNEEKIYRHTLPDGREFSGTKEQAEKMCPIIGKMSVEDRKATFENADLAEKIAERGRAKRQADLAEKDKDYKYNNKIAEEKNRKDNRSENEKLSDHNAQKTITALEIHDTPIVTEERIRVAQKIAEVESEQKHRDLAKLQSDEDSKYLPKDSENTSDQIDELRNPIRKTYESTTHEDNLAIVQHVIQPKEEKKRDTLYDISNETQVGDNREYETLAEEKTVAAEVRSKDPPQPSKSSYDKPVVTIHEMTVDPSDGQTEEELEQLFGEDVVDRFDTEHDDALFEDMLHNFKTDGNEEFIKPIEIDILLSEITIDENYIAPEPDVINVKEKAYDIEVMDTFEQLVEIAALEDKHSEEVGISLDIFLHTEEDPQIESNTTNTQGPDVFSKFNMTEISYETAIDKDFEAIKVSANEQPLDETFLQLAILLKNSAHDSSELAEVANELKNISTNSTFSNEVKDKQTQITPELTSKILTLIRLIGYENPQKVLLEFVTRHNFEYLIHAVGYLTQITYQNENHEILNIKNHSPFQSGINIPINELVGKAVLSFSKAKIKSFHPAVTA